MEHAGVSFSVVEMSFPHSWKWTVGKGKTVSVGVCSHQTRCDPSGSDLYRRGYRLGSVNHRGAGRSRARSSISGSSPERNGAQTLLTIGCPR